MKKYITSICIVLVLMISILSGKSYAISLDNLNVNLDKTVVRPGENIEIKIYFGALLEEYIFNIAYDNKIFEYVSSEGGDAIDQGNIVELKFSKKENDYSKDHISLIFKAKNDITTSNPTNFAVTGKNFKIENSDEYVDNMDSSISKEVLVEPEYEDYVINLDYEAEEIIANKETNMQISITSNIGRYYEKAKLFAKVTPTDSTSRMIAINEEDKKEYDLFKTFWKDDGYKIGGKDVTQVLNVTTMFEKSGEYSVTLNLVDGENNDNIIVSKTVNLLVNENLEDGNSNNIANNDLNTTNIINNIENTNIASDVSAIENSNINLKGENSNVQTNTNTVPNMLPKTGSNIYIPILIITLLIISLIIYINNKNKIENDK